MRVADQVGLRDPELGRGIRPVAGVCSRRPPLALLREIQRHTEDHPSEDTALSPALGIGAFLEKTLVAAWQRPKVEDQARGSGPARLRYGRARAASEPVPVKLVFVSHATVDSDLVEQFVDMILKELRSHGGRHLRLVNSRYGYSRRAVTFSLR